MSHFSLLYDVAEEVGDRAVACYNCVTSETCKFYAVILLFFALVIVSLLHFVP